MRSGLNIIVFNLATFMWVTPCYGGDILPHYHLFCDPRVSVSAFTLLREIR